MCPLVNPAHRSARKRRFLRSNAAVLRHFDPMKRSKCRLEREKHQFAVYAMAGVFSKASKDQRGKMALSDDEKGVACMMNKVDIQVMDRRVRYTRSFDVPRVQVFQAWIDPKQMSQWWGPHTFSNPICEIDARPGGAYKFVMRSDDGKDYPITGVYKEVTKPSRILFTHRTSKPTGIGACNGNANAAQITNGALTVVK